jgi:hypothetical protein
MHEFNHENLMIWSWKLLKAHCTPYDIIKYRIILGIADNE